MQSISRTYNPYFSTKNEELSHIQKNSADNNHKGGVRVEVRSRKINRWNPIEKWLNYLLLGAVNRRNLQSPWQSVDDPQSKPHKLLIQRRRINFSPETKLERKRRQQYHLENPTDIYICLAKVGLGEVYLSDLFKPKLLYLIHDGSVHLCRYYLIVFG